MKNIVLSILISGMQVAAVHEGEPGRDQYGMFNEHMEYVKARNKLNQDEEKHRDSFENIMDKLNDQEFMNTAISSAVQKGNQRTQGFNSFVQTQAPTVGKPDLMTDKEAQCYLDRYPDIRGVIGTLNEAKKHWLNHGRREKRIKTCEGTLTDAEAQCYLDRYTDLAKIRAKQDAIAKAKEHWLEQGAKEGRHRHCAPRISDQQAQCFLDKNPELQKQFGADNWAWAKEYYYAKGHKNGKDFKCEGKQPAVCAEEGNECTCDGIIFLVRKGEKTNPDIKSTWEEGFNWKYSQALPVNGKQKCDASILDDPAPGKAKHCLCEVKPTRPAYKCADEGQECKCQGNVFYGRKFVKGTTSTTFQQLVDKPYKVKKSLSSIKCNSKVFGDPTPGMAKHCFCDQSGTYTQEDIDADMKEFEAKKDEEKAESQVEGALAAKEKAEKEAERVAAEAEAAQAKAKAEQAAKEAAAKAAEKAAREKAEEIAKASRAKAFKKKNEDQEAAQKEEKEAQLKELEAQKAKAAAGAAAQEAEHAKAIEKAQKRLLAHAAKVDAERQAAEARALAKKAKEDAHRAEVMAKIEESRIAAEKAKAEAAAIKAKDAAVTAAAADAAKVEAEKTRDAAAAASKAAEADRVVAAVEASVQRAIAQFQKESEEKAALAAKERARKLEEKKKAEAEAKRKAEEAVQAEKLAEIKAKQDAKKAKEEAEAAERKILADRKAAEAENKKLAQQQRRARIAAEKARHKQLKAQKEEELATTQEEIKAAQAAAAKAQEALKAAEEERKKIEEEKKALEAKRAVDEERLKVAQEHEATALAAQQASAKKIKELNAQAEADQKQAEEDIAEAEREAAEKEAALKAAREANIKKLADAKKREEAAHKAAQEAAHKALKDALKARKSQDKRQKMDLLKKMAGRRADFAEKYEHVWVSGPPGVSVIQVTFADGVAMDALLEELFSENLIADVENASSGLSRSFLRDGKLVVEDGEQYLIMTTIDEHVKEVMKVIEEKSPDPQYDLVVTKPATGNMEYIDWIKSNTITREAARAAAEKARILEADIPDSLMELDDEVESLY